MAFYVFGYGSLMWRPGFPHEWAALGTVHGLHRRLCVYSFVHRGTRERPGLVMGLDAGGECAGMVFKVAKTAAEDVLAYLREREQVTMVYKEQTLPVRLSGGETVRALTYVVDTAHEQYAGRLSEDETVAHVRGAVGRSGRNEDYVIATADHLVEAGVADPALTRLAMRLR
ncbi:MAG: gamma-glutamylcyclotransferase [Pseudomonadota bacterium]